MSESLKLYELLHFAARHPSFFLPNEGLNLPGLELTVDYEGTENFVLNYTDSIDVKWTILPRLGEDGTTNAFCLYFRENLRNYAPTKHRSVKPTLVGFSCLIDYIKLAESAPNNSCCPRIAIVEQLVCKMKIRGQITLKKKERYTNLINRLRHSNTNYEKSYSALPRCMVCRTERFRCSNANNAIQRLRDAANSLIERELVRLEGVDEQVSLNRMTARVMCELEETTDRVRYQVWRLVSRLGVVESKAVLERTKEALAIAEMALLLKNWKWTAGDIFLHLAWERIEELQENGKATEESATLHESESQP